MGKIHDPGRDPAFPQNNDRMGDQGITKRDWFAGLWLSGRATDPIEDPVRAARMAYEMADAMIAESERD